jgi:hypothetical protein
MFSRIARLLSEKPSNATAPLIDTLEKRELFAVSDVAIVTSKIKVKNNFNSGGINTNTSTVTVRFTENVTLVDASKFRMIGYVTNPVGGAQRKVTVGISNLTQDATYPNIFTFTTNTLSPKTGRIIIDAGGVRDSGGDDVVQNVQPPKGQNKERFTLARRAFRPTDLTLFPTSVQPGGSNGAVADDDVPEGTVTSSFTSFMSKKVTAGLITQSQYDRAVALYNSNNTKAIVPNANLRAALASLIGTVGEPAINAILSAQNETGRNWTIIDFSSETRPSAVVGESYINPDTGRIRTLFKEEYRGEPFQALAGYIAHETLHTDNFNSTLEETFTNTVETMVYAQHLLGFRGWIFSNTQLTQQGNAKLMAMLNSGSKVFPRVGIYTAPKLNSGNQVFYQSGTYTDTSFANYMNTLYTDRGYTEYVTPGNDTLNAFYSAITSGQTPTTSGFGNPALSGIDANQTVITDKLAIRLAGLLGLTNFVA